jgi:hypothetical protein
MLGAAAATGSPKYRPIRCLPKVAAYAELPRPQVTTTRGWSFLSDLQSSLRGPLSTSDWRDSTSGDSRSSAAINSSSLLTGVPGLANQNVSDVRALAPMHAMQSVLEPILSDFDVTYVYVSRTRAVWL